MKHTRILLLLGILIWVCLGTTSCSPYRKYAQGQQYWEKRHRYDYKQKRYYYPRYNREDRARWQSRK